MSSSINPLTIGILTKVFWTSGPNSVVLAGTDDELSGGQAQNGVIFYFEGEFDLEGKGQSPPKTIGTLTKVFYIYGLNLVILAWVIALTSKWLTHGRTDRRRQRQYPMAIQASGNKIYPGIKDLQIFCVGNLWLGNINQQQ